MSEAASSAMSQKLRSLPLWQGHLAWGPLNSLVFLVGVGMTLGLQRANHPVPNRVVLASGVAALVVLLAMQIGRRWDHALAANVIVGVAFASIFPGYRSLAMLLGGFTLATLVAASFQVVSQWDKAVLLRNGRFRGLRGPGLFFILPFLDRLESFVDQRVRATDFRAERILTLDTVPVFVDAICFWLVWDAEKAVLEVASYEQAVILSAQTALKDAVGKHELADLLSDRQKLGEEIRSVLDEKTNPWGITIQSVEITDVMIPEGLEEAMSRRAQAERERQARVILSAAEEEIAEKFSAAADRYRDDPTALHLRAMNMVYEGIRQNGSMIIVPSSAVESMGLGTLSGLAALGHGRDPATPLAQSSTEEPDTDD